MCKPVIVGIMTCLVASTGLCFVLFGYMVLLMETAKVDEELSLKKCPMTSIGNQCKKFQRKNGNFRIPIPSEKDVADSGHLMGLKPLRYDLNITMNYVGGTTDSQPIPFSGQITMHLKTVKSTSAIVFHLNEEVTKFDKIQLTEHCSNKAICIKSITSNTKSQEVLVQLEKNLKANSFYDLTISFKGAKDLESRGIYRSGSDKNKFAIITLFQMRYARKVFPSMDHPSLKAKFSFCLKYRKGQYGLSNTETVYQKERNGLIERCFDKTPPIPTYTFTFCILKGYTSERLISNDTRTFPTIVSLSKKSKKQDRLKYIIPEAQGFVKRMIEITKTPYGLDRLVFVNAAPSPFWGIENFGMVTFDAGWMVDPEFDQPHQIIAHEVIHQWMGNSFTISYWDEICLQEGFTGYMEWKLSSEHNLTETTFEQKLQEARFEAMGTEDFVSNPVIQPFGDTQQIAEECFKKPPQVFHMIEHAFGEDTIEKFLSYMSQKYKYANAGLKEWKAGFIKAAGRKEAGDMLEAWFTEKGIPLLVAKEEGSKIIVSQKTADNNTVVDKVTFPLPVEFIDSSSKSKEKLMTNKAISFKTDPNISWFLIDPDKHTYSRAIYPAKNYQSLLKCYDEISKKKSKKSCSLKIDQIKSALDDFCWALYRDQFPVEKGNFDKKTWEKLFRSLNRFSKQTRLYCEICLKKETEVKDRKDDWVKLCGKLKIVRLLGKSTSKATKSMSPIRGPPGQKKNKKLGSRIPR